MEDNVTQVGLGSCPVKDFSDLIPWFTCFGIGSLLHKRGRFVEIPRQLYNGDFAKSEVYSIQTIDESTGFSSGTGDRFVSMIFLLRDAGRQEMRTTGTTPGAAEGFRRLAQIAWVSIRVICG